MHKFDDIVPPSRRNKESGGSSTTTSSPRAPRRTRFPKFSVLMLVVVAIGSIAALFYFASAKIEIVPNHATAAVQSSMTADAAEGLPYRLVVAEKIATKKVKGTGTKNVTSNASGSITVYNTQSKAQPLVTKTRFQTSAGLVYRIQAPITVPAGSEENPGSVVAKVVADQPGSTYNIGPSSFTVPGLAGTPQATQVYARSTTAMAGGASGPVPTVDEADEAKARDELTAALAPDLNKALTEQLPEGYVLVPGASSVTYQTLDPKQSDTAGEVEVQVQGRASAVVFPNESLAKAIARTVVGLNYQGEPLTLRSVEELKLVPGGEFPIDEATPFAFTLSGNAPLVYTVDPDRVAAAVAGEARSAAQVALSNYPEISRAVIVLRPFWKKSFPEDPASINVVVLDPS